MIYFDNAATSYPKPYGVSNAVSDALKIYGGNPGRSGHTLSVKTSEQIFKVRNKIASFFDAEVENVIFTLNCTYALNMAIHGICRAGMHVISSNLEHNSVARPLYYLQKKKTIQWDTVCVQNLSNADILQRFAQRIRPNTKLIVCTHASNVTGQVLPIHDIGKLCRKHGITFIVDAAQSAGILPISIKKDAIDILCAPGHKGLYGPAGTGIMILGSGQKLKTILQGGTGSKSIDLQQPDFSPDRFEPGTVNIPGICGLGAGIDFIIQKGRHNLYQHELYLCHYALRLLKQIPNITIYGDHPQIAAHAPVLSLNIQNLTSMQVTEALNKEGFALRGGLHCAPLTHRALGTTENGTVRFSPSVFNNRKQVEAFSEAIEKIAASSSSLK